MSSWVALAQLRNQFDGTADDVVSFKPRESSIYDPNRTSRHRSVLDWFLDNDRMTAALSPSDIKTELTEYFASILRVPAHHIGSDVHILELGVDSIMLIEAQRWLKARFDSFVEVQQFFEELNTIERLAGFLEVSRSNRPLEPGVAAPSQLIGAMNSVAELQAFQGQTVPASSNAYGLMRSQLALLGEVIEAQNRLLIRLKQPKA